MHKSCKKIFLLQSLFFAILNTQTKQDETFIALETFKRTNCKLEPNWWTQEVLATGWFQKDLYFSVGPEHKRSTSIISNIESLGSYAFMRCIWELRVTLIESQRKLISIFIWFIYSNAYHHRHIVLYFYITKLFLLLIWYVAERKVR